MKKIGVSLALSLFSLSYVFSQASVSPDVEKEDEMVYFYADFTDGIGSDIVTYDLDKQELHFSMKQLGFKQGDAWVSKKEEGLVNYYAASTSKYKYASGVEHQPADDWMVLPEVWIKGKEATLTWRGKSVCNQAKNKSCYKVLVSTTGNEPKDFTEEPVFIIDEEASDKWTEHSVSLASYEGKRIYVAFVNNSLDKEILAIDDVKMKGRKGLCELVVDTKPYVYGTKEVKVEATLTAYTDEPITSFTAYYSHGGKTYSKSFENLSIKHLESYSFAFDESIPASCGDTLRYDMWAEVNGQMQEKIACQTVSFLFQTKRKIVFEEGTGMWCGWCPAGIVAMELLAEKYPEEFLGIAIHYDDLVSLDDYVKDLGIPGFPSAFINRKFLCSKPMVKVIKDGKEIYTAEEGGFETYFLKAKNEPAVADLKVDATVDGDKAKVNVTTRFAIGRNGYPYQLAVLYIEDGVTGDGEEYYQANYYAGEKVPMGGYEALPATIRPAVLNHVARCIYDDYRGIPGSIPEQIEAGTEYSFTYMATPPATIQNIKNAKIVVLLIDQLTGEVVNANEVQAPPVGIGQVKTADSFLACVQEGNGCCLKVTPTSDDPVVIRMYNAEGVLLIQDCVDGSNGDFTYPIDTTGRKGLHVITAEQGTATSAVKVMF